MAKKRRSQKRKAPADADGRDNPLLQGFRSFMDKVPVDDRRRIFSPDFGPDRRGELWMAQADVGEALVNRHSWAVPDERAVRILRHFAPLVEIGCGSNAYWCHLLQQQGVDIIGYDANLQEGGRIRTVAKTKTKHKHRSDANSSDDNPPRDKDANRTDTAIRTTEKRRQVPYLRKGGPEALTFKKHAKSNRTLFLCYPDDEDMDEDDSDHDDDRNDRTNQDGSDGNGEDNDRKPESMAAACLRHYKGTYVIHVGETFMDANLSMDQAPWGRSSSSEFQQRLAAEYHCILKASLPSWFHVTDTISVWKRSQTSSIVFAPDSDDEDNEADEVLYRYVPQEERLPVDIAAPCVQHLLKTPRTEHTAVEDSTKKTKTLAVTDAGAKKPPAKRSNADGGTEPSESARKRRKMG